MATDKLSIYNGALRLLSERKLVSLSENVETRRVLDSIWDDSFIEAVLAQGQWTWAVRAVKMEADPAASPPAFGYINAFPKPDDYRRTCAISADEYFNEPLTAYTDEKRVLYADYNIIYAKYVSSDPAYGGDLSSWPAEFCKFAHAYMAVEAAPRITGVVVSVESLKKTRKETLSDAQGIDGSDKPTIFPSRGSWNNARHGRAGLSTLFRFR